MYLSAIGFGMVVGGIVIHLDSGLEDFDQLDKLFRAVREIFAGGFITTLFWVRKYIIFITVCAVLVCAVLVYSYATHV